MSSIQWDKPKKIDIFSLVQLSLQFLPSFLSAEQFLSTQPSWSALWFCTNLTPRDLLPGVSVHTMRLSIHESTSTVHFGMWHKEMSMFSSDTWYQWANTHLLGVLQTVQGRLWQSGIAHVQRQMVTGDWWSAVACMALLHQDLQILSCVRTLTLLWCLMDMLLAGARAVSAGTSCLHIVLFAYQLASSEICQLHVHHLLFCSLSFSNLFDLPGTG